MLYCLKAARKLGKAQCIPCSDCKSQKYWKDERFGVPLSERDKFCFQYCEYPILLELLDEEQRKLYEKFRPPEKKAIDI